MTDRAEPPKFGDIMGTPSRAENDWYCDPVEATEALLRAERFSGASWDPACGVGTIPKTMLQAGLLCHGSDIVDRGYGFTGHDFIADGMTGEFLGSPIANIVANPPFKHARGFVDRALSIASHKVAFLLPLTFLEGEKRGRWFETVPLARVHVFSWRISMPPGELLQAGAVKAEGGKKAFAWFVFEHGWRGPPQVGFLIRPLIMSATPVKVEA